MWLCNNPMIRICEIDIMFIIIGIRKTLEIGSGTKLLFTFLSLRFFDMRSGDTQFLFMLTFPSDPTTGGTFRRPTTGLAEASSENRLFHSEFKSQLTVFFKSPKSSALPCMTSVTSLALFPIWDFYCDISDCHIRSARAWTPALNVCT